VTGAQTAGADSTADEILAKVRLVQASIKKLLDNNTK
jgi:hypothetical protein